jgi:hypothetical protein
MTRSRLVLAGAAALVALNLALWLVQGGLALPASFLTSLFGPRLVRAEVVAVDAGGAVHDYRIDRGVLRAISGQTLTLRERNGADVSMAVSPSARVTLGGTPVPLRRLRVGMNVLTIRDGDLPAQTVEARKR